MDKVSVAILMTCFNRINYTERCLKTIHANTNENIKVDVYLVDDGCTDGTSQMVKDKFPNVKVIKGNGNLFWNKGMHLSFSTAVKNNYNFYLWVNDDVEFDDDILNKLVSYYFQVKKKDETIVVGYTENAERTGVTYSAFRKKKSLIPMATTTVMPSDKPEKCTTFHGNCVLIHRSVVEKIGIIDPYYSHGIGDSDYGYTASRNGCDILLTTFPVGICEKNYIYDGLYRKNMTLTERFKFATGRKQRPVKDWWHFTIKNGGPLGILRFLVAYVKIPVIHLKYKYKK